MIEREGNIVSLNEYILDLSKIKAISNIYSKLTNVGQGTNNSVEGNRIFYTDITFEPELILFTQPEIKISIPLYTFHNAWVSSEEKTLKDSFKLTCEYQDYQTLIKWWKEEINTKKNLYNICNEWIKKHKPTCAESLIQVDSINLALHEIVQNICNEIGYYKYNDE